MSIVRGIAARARAGWAIVRDRRGQALVEYALILALVAIAAIVALNLLGGHASNTLSNVANAVNQ